MLFKTKKVGNQQRDSFLESNTIRLQPLFASLMDVASQVKAAVGKKNLPSGGSLDLLRQHQCWCWCGRKAARPDAALLQMWDYKTFAVWELLRPLAADR